MNEEDGRRWEMVTSGGGVRCKWRRTDRIGPRPRMLWEQVCMLVVVLAGSLTTGDKTIGKHRREKWVDVYLFTGARLCWLVDCDW